MSTPNMYLHITTYPEAEAHAPAIGIADLPEGEALTEIRIDPQVDGTVIIKAPLSCHEDAIAIRHLLFTNAGFGEILLASFNAGYLRSKNPEGYG